MEELKIGANCSPFEKKKTLTPRVSLAQLMAEVQTIKKPESHLPASPTNLPISEIIPPQPFPLGCLPSSCKAMARAIYETVRVWAALPGCCILGIVSAAIGRGLQVKSGPNRLTRGNLYTLTSADSGSGKSETFRHVAKPFLDFEAERIATWKAESKHGLLADVKILEEEIAQLKRSAGKSNSSTQREEIRAELREKLAALDKVETNLQTPVLSCEDVTGEKLAVLLAFNGEQLASLGADAIAIVNILLGRYNKLDRTDEGIYLKAFTGDRCKLTGSRGSRYWWNHPVSQCYGLHSRISSNLCSRSAA